MNEMKVSDLKDKTAVDDLTIKITEVREPQETRVGQVQQADAEDETGSCTITLWVEQVGQYSEGDNVVIKNGWCKQYQGQLQVSSGKYGTIEKTEE